MKYNLGINNSLQFSEIYKIVYCKNLFDSGKSNVLFNYLTLKTF